MRRPSTRMSSRDGSALVPNSRTVWPLTETRPSASSCSEARREATPAADRIFCKRITRQFSNTWRQKDASRHASVAVGARLTSA